MRSAAEPTAHEPEPYGDEAFFGGGPLRPRGRRPSPIASIALLAGAIALIAGVGFGYRLEQQPIVPPTAVPPVSTAAAPTAPPPPVIDLGPDGVSIRLQQAYVAEAPAQWAVCGLGASISCHVLNRTLSLSQAVSYTDSFTTADWASLGPPPIGPGHLALAAALGEGRISGSLVLLDDPTNTARNRPLVPIDPSRAGIDYFDLGPLAPGHYAIVIGVTQPAADISSAQALQTYLSGFTVTG